MGTTGHADDIRTTTSAISDLSYQARFILEYAHQNFLKLNASKCELLILGPSKETEELLQDLPFDITPSDSCSCLGVWWSPDLSPKTSIEHNIKNARKCFFAMGSKGVFHGIANPLTSKTIIDTCVMPTCLSGCENWILNEPLLESLEAFQGFVGCRALELSKYHCHSIPLITLGLPSMRARILRAKLCFLHRVSDPARNCISTQAFRNLNRDEYEVSVIQQCRFLQEPYEMDFTSAILTSEGCRDTLKSVKEDLLQADSILTTTKARGHQSLNHLLQVNIPWLAVWDEALNRGPQATGHATRLLAALSKSSFGNSECNLCRVPYRPQSYFQHLAASHLLTNSEQLMAELSASADIIFETGRKLSKL